MSAPPLNTASAVAAEHRGLVVGSAGMMVAGFLTTFLSPLLAVSFAKEFSFGTQYAGVLVAAGQTGVAVAALAVLPILPRLDRRALGIAGAVLTALCLAGTGLLDDFWAVLAVQIVMGLGAGLCYAAANSALAYARHPERAFSIVTISWMLAGAAMLTLGPMLHDAWPHEGIYLGMAAAELLCVVFIMRLPDVRRLPKNDPVTEGGPRAGAGTAVPAALLVGALLLMNVGNMMIWTYAQSIGERTGLSTEFTSTFLGLSQLVGLIGSGLTLALGGRVSKMLIVVPAVVVLAVGNLLVGTSTGPAPFTIGFLAVNVAFFCLSPLLLALAAELDTRSGQLVVIAGAASLVAGSIAPALGGAIAGPDEHWARLGFTALSLALVAIPLLVLPVRRARSSDPEPQARTEPVQ
ncbi:MAG: MFS transporter [Actinomycetota bacterium]|nr:MFS transporter [Actinomycetota bacterium]